MFLDYPGQELIWRLRGNHPYQKNYPCYSVNLYCKSEKENIEFKKFFCKHLKKEDIVEIITEKNIWNSLGGDIVKEIHIKTVFENISVVRFYNKMNKKEF